MLKPSGELVAFVYLCTALIVSGFGALVSLGRCVRDLHRSMERGASVASIRSSFENARPAIITVGLITAAQGFVATLMMEGPTAPAIMLAGLITIALALVPGTRRPGS